MKLLLFVMLLLSLSFIFVLGVVPVSNSLKPQFLYDTRDAGE